jgi:uncharacterized protein YlaI
MTAGTLIASPEPVSSPVTPPSRPPYSCPQCRHRLRSSGRGRHRVYFELGDPRVDHPIMDGVCPECGHSLPGKSS